MPKAKAYNGRVRIECLTSKTCPRKVGKDVLASCLDCPEGIIEILGPEGEALATLRITKPKPKKGAQHGR